MSPNIITPSELVELASYDTKLFEREFFPNAAKVKDAHFHPEIWRLLESSARQVNIQVPRGFAKTTKLRMYLAKRIAYGLSNTILYVGVSQDKAVQSLSWLRKAVEHNAKFRDCFLLSPGDKWTETDLRIINGFTQQECAVLAYGVTGSIRGVNIDDHRPDLIIVDDIVSDENAATPEQRAKIHELLYGAILASLAPRTDSPDAKVVMLQTPLNKEEVSTKALTDPSWLSVKYSCWTDATKDLPDNEKESAWEERYPTPDLRALKQSYLQRNNASTWYREYECRITSPETSVFKPEWLKFYDLPPERGTLHIVGAIDPVPPPSETQLAKGMKGKDYEALGILGTTDGSKFYLLDYVYNRGHEPNWTISEFFRLSLKWNPATWVVETVGYQKTLEWILRKAMQERRIFYPIYELKDKRGKFDRINDALAGPASNGVFYCHKSHTEFISQFCDYPDVTHDDVLDMVSMGMANFNLFTAANRGIVELTNQFTPNMDSNHRPILRRGAP